MRSWASEARTSSNAAPRVGHALGQCWRKASKRSAATSGSRSSSNSIKSTICTLAACSFPKGWLNRSLPARVICVRQLNAERVEAGVVVVDVNTGTSLQERDDCVGDRGHQHFDAHLQHVGYDHDLDNQMPRPLSCVRYGKKD